MLAASVLRPKLALSLALLGAIAVAVTSAPAQAQSPPSISITCPTNVPLAVEYPANVGSVECTFTASATPSSPISIRYGVSALGSRGLSYQQQVETPTRVSADRILYHHGTSRITVSLWAGSGYTLGSPSTATITIGSQLPSPASRGVNVNQSGALDGYLLLTSAYHNRFYLIDNQGREAYRWERAGGLGKLLDNGNVLTGDDFTDVAEIKPDGTDAYTYPGGHQHHEVLKLSNGNYMFLVSEFYSRHQSIAAGANPDCLEENGLEVDAVVEVSPSGTSGGTVVWKWSVWDHLIQDHDSTKDNYGVVADHPERIDINYGICQLNRSPNNYIRNPHHLTHINAIDYHPTLNQILLTSRHFSEVWVIDRSTTTAQAAATAGGDGGMGGDLLYRYGNPRTHKNGARADQTLFFPHAAHWIPFGLPGAGNILIYNNGHEHPGFSRPYASAEELVLPASGHKYLRAGTPYMAATTVWTHQLPDSTWVMSNAQRLPNGNTLITEGAFGRIYEVTQDHRVVWHYVSPLVGGHGVLSGQASPARLRDLWIYRTYKYAASHPGILALSLTPEGERPPIITPNEAPTVASAIADATIVNESGTREVSLAGVFDDADSDALTITAASSDENVATASVAADQSSLTVTAQARGTATMTVTADDGKGGTVSDEFTVTVKSAPVVAAAISDPSGLKAGATRTVSLSGVFSDADGDALTITAVSGDEAVTTVSVASDGSTLTVAGLVEGTATITVTAQDADGNTVSDAFDVSVGPEHERAPSPPRLSAPLPDLILTGPDRRVIALSGVFSDADGDVLTITAVSGDEAVTTVSVASDSSALTVVGVSTGTATVTVTAEDADGNRVSDAFDVTVLPEPERPQGALRVSTPLPDLSLKATTWREFSLSDVFSGADVERLIFIAVSSKHHVASMWVDGTTLTVVGIRTGTATITVTARDMHGNRVSDSFEVTVRPFS